MHAECYFVLTTTANPETAESLARFAVQNHLAACGNILQNVRSIYAWKKEICDEKECLLLLKTANDKVDELIRKLREKHPYEVPELVAIPVEKCDPDYLAWIRDWIRSGP